MGVAALGRIAGQLMAHGREATTPVAIVENGSRPEQLVTLATLAALDDVARRPDIQSPALLIVGEVAALAAQLHWFGSRPRLWEAMRSAA